jgi:two-component system, OmpR family, sensor kinase
VSLRARLLVGLGAVAVVLVGVAVAVTRASQAYLVEQVDARLPAGSDAESEPGHGDAAGGPTRPFSPYWFGTVDGDVVTTVRSPDLGADDSGAEGGSAPVPDVDAADARAAADGGDPYFTVGSDDPGVRYRVRATAGGDGRIDLVATSLEDVDAAVARLVTVEVVATAAVLGLLGLVAFWVLRLGVRPLKAMTRTATAIAGGDLGHRVPPAPARTEAGELGAALNAMLARIEGSFAVRQASEDRLRRFVADASHELRTPVTTIRGYAELHRQGALDDPDDLAQAMRRTEAEAQRMTALVDDMLLLARLDRGRPLDRRPVDLGVLAIDAAGDARATAPTRAVRASTQEGVVVEGDEDRLRQVLANLVGNALMHTPPTATISVAARAEEGGAVLEVRDDGPGMPADQAAHAFERFYRGDPGRARARGGSGLGLAIVQAIAVAHGGRASLVTAPGEGTTVRVELPRAPAPEPVGVAG